MAESKSLTFSIVIPTLNEAKFIPNLLKDLAAQSWSSFEVIVVDAQSSDKTKPKVLAFQKKLKLTWVESPQANVSVQRNLGAKTAQGTWIIFMDADNRLPKFFLLGIAYQLERHPKTKAFTTWIDSKAYRNKDEAIIASTYNWGLNAYAMMKKPTAVGALIGVHHSITKKINFQITDVQFEDSDFVQQINRHHWPFMTFKHPAYVYSMRRFHKEGTLKMVRLMAQANFNSLLGRTNSGVLKKYPMIGGDYYQKTTVTQSASFFSRLQQLITTIPKKELQRLQNTLVDILE